MAVRLLLLLVVMLVFAALYGCAQEAAKDRQPMKRVKEPTTAESTPHTPEESDDHVQRTKKAGVVVSAGNSAVVARAGQAVVRVGGLKSAKAEGAKATASSRKVTLKIEGSPATEFSGMCIVGDEEKKLSGRVPKRFTIYELDGQPFECEISKHSANSGEMKVEFSAGDDTNSVQQTSIQGGSIALRYDGHGSTTLVTSSTSDSVDQANSTSQASVLQSNSNSGRDSH